VSPVHGPEGEELKEPWNQVFHIRTVHKQIQEEPLLPLSARSELPFCSRLTTRAILTAAKLGSLLVKLSAAAPVPIQLWWRIDSHLFLSITLLSVSVLFSCSGSDD